MLKKLRTEERPTSAITKMRGTVSFWTMRRGENKMLLNEGMIFTRK
jgi:hypothetical protein